MSFWADACNSASNRSLQTLLDSAYASCGVTVRCAAAACGALLACIARRDVAGDAFSAQIAAFCASALASGTMFWRWRRMTGEGRRCIEWRLYGWFSGLMLCGSCFGAVAWGSLMQVFVLSFNLFNNPSSIPTNTQVRSIAAQYQRWIAAFAIAYAIEFFCLSAAKLMVLDRMMEFAMPKRDGVSRRWVVGGRVVMAAVVAGNVVGLGGNVAAAVYFERTAEYNSAAFSAFTANNTVDGNNFDNLANQEGALALSTQSLQSFCEVAVLLLIIVAFAVVGAACVRRLSSEQQHHDALVNTADAAAAAPAWRQLRLRIVGTAAFVFVTFLLRAVYSTMFALANALQNSGNAASCPTVNQCDASCYNVYKLMSTWLVYTPEFQLTVVLISSPLALLVALWGMTTDRALRQMQSNRRQKRTMRDVLLPGTG
jgi:hypothetical protein